MGIAQHKPSSSRHRECNRSDRTLRCWPERRQQAEYRAGAAGSGLRRALRVVQSGRGPGRTSWSWPAARADRVRRSPRSASPWAIPGLLMTQALLARNNHRPRFPHRGALMTSQLLHRGALSSRRRSSSAFITSPVSFAFQTTPASPRISCRHLSSCTPSYPGAGIPRSSLTPVSGPRLSMRSSDVEDMLYSPRRSTMDGSLTLTLDLPSASEADIDRDPGACGKNRVAQALPPLPRKFRSLGSNQKNQTSSPLPLTLVREPHPAIGRLLHSLYPAQLRVLTQGCFAGCRHGRCAGLRRCDSRCACGSKCPQKLACAQPDRRGCRARSASRTSPVAAGHLAPPLLEHRIISIALNCRRAPHTR